MLIRPFASKRPPKRTPHVPKRDKKCNFERKFPNFVPEFSKKGGEKACQIVFKRFSSILGLSVGWGAFKIGHLGGPGIFINFGGVPKLLKNPKLRKTITEGFV